MFKAKSHQAGLTERMCKPRFSTNLNYFYTEITWHTNFDEFLLSSVFIASEHP